MKWISFLLAMLPIGGSASATEPGEKSKSCDFAELPIEGQMRRPAVEYLGEKQNADSDRTLRLRRSFVVSLVTTARDPVLR